VQFGHFFDYGSLGTVLVSEVAEAREGSGLWLWFYLKKYECYLMNECYLNIKFATFIYSISLEERYSIQYHGSK
jgi:hypothetical protein